MAGTKLDSNQIFQRAFDEETNRLRVETAADVIISVGEMEMAVDHSEDSIRIGDGTDLMSVNPDGSINVYKSLREKIVNDSSVTAAYTWLDWGTSTERLGSVVYTSPTYPGNSTTKTYNYVLDNGSYKLTSVVWSVI